jgi:hypothetical protein
MDRYVRALADKRALEHGQRRDDFQLHVIGAWGEAVIAKATGIYWAGDLGAPDRGAPDVGRFHVRATLRPDGRLILHPDDHDDAPYVLVVPQRLPRFCIVGWCYGRDGKQAAYWENSNGRPAFFVPWSALTSFAQFMP